ncbi:MAG TPA: SDR family NAD(P)-dependent oxidoreductase [Gemmatimonadaceae bacterium]
MSDSADREIKNRVVIITGGGGAVGSVVSRRWLEAGARVVVVDHRQSTIDEWKSNLDPAFLERIATLAADLSTDSGAMSMVETATSAFGNAPDTLIHLVGGFAMAAVEDENAQRTWERMMSINLTSAFQCYRAVLPSMRSRGGGWIVGLSSRAANAPAAKMSAYGASKAGLAALTSSLSSEVRSAGIHVNLIVASTIDTEANRESMGADKAKNWVSPDDIADATMYLCSDRARSVHGATLEVFAYA